jgi:hypothetical protein
MPSISSGPPQAPQAPRALGESTPEGAPPGTASLLPEPDSPLTVRPSHPERAIVRGINS